MALLIKVIRGVESRAGLLREEVEKVKCGERERGREREMEMRGNKRGREDGRREER